MSNNEEWPDVIGGEQPGAAANELFHNRTVDLNLQKRVGRALDSLLENYRPEKPIRNSSEARDLIDKLTEDMRVTQSQQDINALNRVIQAIASIIKNPRG